MSDENTKDVEDIEYMDIAEFREEGYLQELNRRFLHPLGLAMDVVVEEDGTERLGGVWDYREDPEGIRFHKSVDLHPKADNIHKIAMERAPKREQVTGYWVQPVPAPEEESDG